MAIVGTIFRFLFAWLDSIVAIVITLLYNLLTNLANLVLYSEDIIKVLGQRIGLILGIFMLFRLAITLINYLISPDKINDNSKGGAKVILNIVVSLFLLATVNIIFTTGYRIQKQVINSNIIEKVFFGTGEVPRIDIGYYLHSAFFTPNEKVLLKCNEIWDTSIQLTNTECNTELTKVLEDNARKEIYAAKTDMSFKGIFANYDLVIAKDSNGEFVFDYIPVLSTAAGVAVIIVLISFSMDLATRAIKLLFLQIIAPIPIISNMDPGKGKDIFQKWYKECFSTYLSVFIRLIAINFAIFLIGLIKSEFKSIFNQNIFINVFIIIGCLMFAKQVPKLIEDILGIKMDGMALNPLKKFNENALLGKQIGGLGRGVVAGAIGVGAGAVGASIASNRLGHKWSETLGSGVIGAFRGGAGGLISGYKEKNAFKAVGAGFGRFKTNAEYVQSLDGTSPRGLIASGMQQRLGLKTAADDTKDQIETIGKFVQASDSALKRAEAESVKYDKLALKDGTTMADHKIMQEELTRLRNTELDKSNYTSPTGVFYDDAYEEAVAQRDRKIKELQDKILYNQKQFATQYITDVVAGNLIGPDDKLVVDGELTAYVTQLEDTKKELSERWDVNFETRDDSGNISGAAIKGSKQEAIISKQNLENSKLYEQQKANAAATKPKGK